MTIRFKISCRSCSCAFEVDSKHFSSREHLQCPNCGQPFPDKEFQQLVQAMAGLNSICEVCAESSSEKGFDIAISSTYNESDGLPF